MGGNFHVENSIGGVSIGLSTFKNCYTCYAGGAFTLVSTTLTDIGSTFTYNAATQGGVFYCDDCVIST